MHKQRVINPKRWYIVDLTKKSRLGFYPLFRVSFPTQVKAKAAVKRNFEKRDRILVEVIKGEAAIEYGMNFKKRNNWYKKRILKYDYPPDRYSLQDRKSFRTKYRRWKRTFKKELNHRWS